MLKKQRTYQKFNLNFKLSKKLWMTYKIIHLDHSKAPLNLYTLVKLLIIYYIPPF